MSNDELVSATRELARRSCAVEADLLLHLGEIDARKIYLDRAHPSMFAFCTRELGFSEGAAYNRIHVARIARSLPAVIEALRSGLVHLAGLRILAPHLTNENHADLLRRAAGRSKEEIALLAAALAPRPAASVSLRKLPEHPTPRPLTLTQPPPRPDKPPPPPVMPIAEETYKLQMTISREFREEIREAQSLLRHRVPDGDLAKIFRAALERYVAEVKKERFALGRKTRSSAKGVDTQSRHVPDAIKRAVYLRDGGRCAFTDETGRRCEERGGLEFDHLDGFARTHRHDIDGLRLLCRAHNQHAADNMYGSEFMDAARHGTRPGTSC
ncbi:MAG TPA: HNH endonuclease [Myxococcales bacterium]|nr:HNH endonuclease [Myxococcales bacterium]